MSDYIFYTDDEGLMNFENGYIFYAKSESDINFIHPFLVESDQIIRRELNWLVVDTGSQAVFI